MLLPVLEAGGAAETSPPNVVVILADDQGWGDLGLTGNPLAHTPHLDRLAGEGVLFDRFYVSPVCSPTRAELLTGRYHQRLGVYSTSAGGERMDPEARTLAEAFREAGYATGAFGKWHNGTQGPYHPNSRGFQEFYGFCSGHWGNYFSPMLEHNGRIVKGEGYLTDDLTGRALSFIEEHREGPFFVYLPLNTPHSPMQVPDAFWERYAELEITLRGSEPDREDLQHTRAALAMVANIDENVDRLVDHLEQLGLRENTLVVYFSDNGPNGHRWNDSLRGVKGSTDEGGVRSPLIVAMPGRIPAGARIGRLASALDLMPTLLDWCGLKPPDDASLDGRSLVPLLRDPGTDWPERILVQSWKGRYSARSPRFRLDHQGRLYDMEADPGQAMAVNEAHPEALHQLHAAINRRQSAYTEPSRETDDRPFFITHPSMQITHLPARDATPEGGLIRSNRYPNCSYLTNWTSLDGAVSWEAVSAGPGRYRVDLYYTCPEGDAGSVLELTFGEVRLTGAITAPHNPPLLGAEADRVPRMESYVKDWRRVTLGTVDLPEGEDTLRLRALSMPGRTVMDFRLLVLERSQ